MPAHSDGGVRGEISVSSAHGLHPRLKLRGHGGLEVHGLVVDGVMETQLPGVQHEAGDMDDLALGVAVDGISQNGVAEAFAHVDADLVGAAGEELAADEGAVLMGGDVLPLGHGFFAGAVIEDGHALSMDGVSADHVLEAPTFFFGQAVDGGEVDFTKAALGEGFGQAAVGDVIFGDDHAAGGVFIEAVDDARAHLSADAAEVVAVMEKGIDEGAVGISCGGVDDEAGGFVEDEDVFVLKKDIERDVLSDDGDGDDLRDDEGDLVSSFQGSAGLGRASVQGHMSVFDQVLEAGAGEIWKTGGEVLIESGAGVGGVREGPFHGSKSIFELI